jgi:hypothetical protein
MQDIFLRNESFFDIMSLVHFASGLGVGLFFVIFKSTFQKIYFRLGILILIVWELFEFFLRFLRTYYPLLLEKLKFIPSGWATNESALNIFSDLITGFIGLVVIYFIFNYPMLKLRMTGKIWNPQKIENDL